MNNEIIIQTIKELLGKMDMHWESVELAPDSKDDHPRFMVKSNDSNVLIGTRGEHLGALTMVARRLVGKKVGMEISPVKFFIDINGYFENNIKELQMRAKIMAERARSFKTNMELEPMTPYERMIIHSALEAFTDIKTESTGFGRDRKVVIKYVESVNQI
ncbi:MAG: R3H domain-containing nucleic acid-binding protein [Candidatus Paceibacterota bacterium]|jgi:spoIIIJ-associated protein